MVQTSRATQHIDNGIGMKKNKNGIFVGTTILCGIGWFSYWVGVAALAKYMADKGYEPPSDEEIKECSLYVCKKLFHLN